MCIRNNRKKISPVSNELTVHLGLFSSDKIVIPEELKKKLIAALHFDYPKSTKEGSAQNHQTLIFRDVEG